MFRVGQKVVCVDIRPTQSGLKIPLTKGEIYTISAMDTTPDEFGGLAFYLAENDWSVFYHWRFRPIVERKTDISIFKAMLTPAGKKERVNAR
jgi:hypothetical protein